MKKLVDLIKYGQSYWLDNLTRHKITSGELQKRVAEQGLRGVTSNPSIFNKAITGSDDYDDQIRRLAEEGKTVSEIYEALTVQDVQDACDILRPVYDQSQGIDGFVSLEVSPYLARDTEGTMQEARRLYKAVDRPNCYIKIPGTRQGVPAIEEMLYEGININVTLLFSIRSYAAVAQAYINAIDRRLSEGKPIDHIVSVASLFISRIDVLVDEMLGHHIIPADTKEQEHRPDALLGKTGTAMAKLTYQRFKEIFSSPEWKAFAEKGAHVQRPLWASTSNKDPLYEDVRYVNALIGPDTVNTLPDKTITAFADHGTLKKDAVDDDLEEARQVFEQLKYFNIHIDCVTQQLENEGIQKFIDAYNKLMSALAAKRNQILSKKNSNQTMKYGVLENEIKAAFVSLDEKRAAMRLFQQDPYLWKSDHQAVNDIRQRLGWLTLPDEMAKKSEDIKAFASEIKKEGYRHVVLLGMGGSSLCSEVSRETYQPQEGFPQLLVLDNVAPEAIRSVERQIDLQKTLFIVASKSGSTTETLSFFHYFFEQLVKTNFEKPGHNFIAITDPETSLVREAESYGFRKIFLNNPNLGGRYSVLSDFGIVPMALMGIDIDKVLASANKMKKDCGASVPSMQNPGVALGTVLGISAKNGRDKITFVMSPSLNAFGYWVEQLLAESTGKEGTGLIPVNGETLGTPSEYGKDRLFIYIHLKDEKEAEKERQLAALEAVGHPVVQIQVNDKLALGAEYYRWEIAVAIAGVILGINAFDQPNVEESKQNTRTLLAAYKKDHAFQIAKPVWEKDSIKIFAGTDTSIPDVSADASLSKFLKRFTDLANEGDYIAFLPYFLMTEKRRDILESWRMRLRNHQKVATTLLAGPRYLHSTGQLHKGGPNTGLFLIFTADNADKLPIPKSDYDFATLDMAEALGDFKALENKQRRLIRIHLGDVKEIESHLQQCAE